MKKLSLILIAIFILISCINKKNYSEEDKSVENLDTIVDKKTAFNSNSEDVISHYVFVDSLKVAKKEKYKIEIKQQTINLKTIVCFHFSEKENNKWKLIQKFDLIRECEIPLLTEVEDFNNDGFNDITIHYSTAGRGANDIRKLFLFRENENKLIEIKNSDLYPNLSYNNKLNCINSLNVYAGSTTTFLKLEKDSLIAFAKVDYMDNIAKSYSIKNNKSYILKTLKYNNDDEIINFSNFNPIEE